MRIYRFECGYNEEYDYLGFRPVWQPEFDYYGGAAVSHDILEHLPNDDASWNAELRALGASLFVRGDSGFWASRGYGVWNDRWSVNVVGEIEDRLMRCAYDSYADWVTPPRGRTGSRLLEDDHEEQIEEMLGILKKRVWEDHHDEAESWGPLLDAWRCDAMRRWFRVGYRLAVKRYRRYSYVDLGYLFGRIESEAERLLNVAEEGDVLGVGIDVGRAQCRLDLLNLSRRLR